MRGTGSLLLLAGLGRSVYGRWRFQRMVSVMIMVAILTVMAAVIMTAVLVGGIYVAYLFLVSQGFSSLVALAAIALAAIAVSLAIVAAIGRGVASLKSPVATPAGEAIDAFLDGLFAKER